MDLNTIKEYNNKVAQMKQSVAQLMAEKKIREQELEKLCSELTEELGKTVTPENIESIYNETIEQIKDTMESGNEILTRIESELGVQNNQNSLAGQSMTQPMQQPTQQPTQQPMQQPMQQTTQGITPSNNMGNRLLDFNSLSI